MRPLALLTALVLLLGATPAFADIVVVQDGREQPPHHRSAPFLVDPSAVPSARHGRFSVTYRLARAGVGRDEFRSFRRQAAATLSDDRGWAAAGAVAFTSIDDDAEFTLWLASPEVVASAAWGCSEGFSCRVGDDVFINVSRWRRGADSYGQQPRRDYRSYVINHEVGHWLGLDHRGCPERGAPAPVLLQQTKGLRGCEARPWPLPAEQQRALELLGDR